MTAKFFLIHALVIPFLAFGCSKAPSAKPSESTNPQLTPQQMQEAFVKASTPGAEHKFLASMVGDWKAVVSMWMNATKPPEVTAGRSANSSKYGGRFIETSYTGTWMGQKFEGTGAWGYDNVTKHYQSSWFDSMSTQLTYAAGTYDAATKKLTLSGVMSCPMSGGPIDVKQVLTIVDENKHIYESFTVGADGKEFRTMEIVYTRDRKCLKCGSNRKRK